MLGVLWQFGVAVGIPGMRWRVLSAVVAAVPMLQGDKK